MTNDSKQSASGCGRAALYGFIGAVGLGFISFLAGFVGPIISVRVEKSCGRGKSKDLQPRPVRGKSI